MFSSFSDFGIPDFDSPSNSLPNLATAFLSQHDRVGVIRTGAKGVVEAWRHSSTGSILAVKVVSRKMRMPADVKILLHLPPHEHIIECLGYVERQPTFEKGSILLEYCPGGDLFQTHSLNTQRDNSTGTFSEDFMWSVYIQITSAIAFLHEGIDSEHKMGRHAWRPIVHGDLKAENILVKSLGIKDDMSDIQLKLGGFGAAHFRILEAGRPPYEIGTSITWPPEMIKVSTEAHRHYSPACDVWAIGTIIHHLAHTFYPIVSLDHVRESWLASGKERPYPKKWSFWQKLSYWGAKAPRRVVPINLELNAPLPGGRSSSDYDPIAANIRRHRPSPKYSNHLNRCMMFALNMDAKGRMCVGALWSTITRMHSDYIIEELRAQHEQYLENFADDDTW